MYGSVCMTMCFLYIAAKVTIAASICDIIDVDGKTYSLSEGADSTGLPETTKQLLEHAQWVSMYMCLS